MGVEECKLIELPVVEDPHGDLAVAEAGDQIPFPIARAYYVYDVPAEAVRGGHAHKSLEQALFCLSGSLEIALDDGSQQRTFTLDDPRTGLYLPPMAWHDMAGFSDDTVYLVLASAPYDEADYFRDRDRFLSAVRGSATEG